MPREDYEPDEWDSIRETFADPGGRSALRAASRRNPRNLPCGAPNRLTPADRAHGDACADLAERGGY